MVFADKTAFPFPLKKADEINFEIYCNICSTLIRNYSILFLRTLLLYNLIEKIKYSTRACSYFMSSP